jgi:hypothetical protein
MGRRFIIGEFLGELDDVGTRSDGAPDRRIDGGVETLVSIILGETVRGVSDRRAPDYSW